MFETKKASALMLPSKFMSSDFPVPTTPNHYTSLTIITPLQNVVLDVYFSPLYCQSLALPSPLSRQNLDSSVKKTASH